VLRRQHHPPGQTDEYQVEHPYGHKPVMLPATRPLPQPNQQVSHLDLVLEPYRVDSGLLENFPYRRRRYRHSQAGQLAVEPAVPPFRILPGQPEDWGLDVPAGRRSAGLAALGPGGPAAG
jgi:hypothetical protein